MSPNQEKLYFSIKRLNLYTKRSIIILQTNKGCIIINNRKILYFRVAADKGNPGRLGPIFQDGTFEYIPISEKNTIEKDRYNNLRGNNNLLLSTYVRGNKALHHDPKFLVEEGLSVYGDQLDRETNKGKGEWKKYKELKREDIVAFYAGLTPWPQRNDLEDAIYLIGYIIVGISIESKLQNLDFQPENAHKKRYQFIIKRIDEFIHDNNLSYLSLYNSLVKYKENPEAMNLKLGAYLQSLNIRGFKSLVDFISESNWKRYYETLEPEPLFIILYKILLHYSSYVLVVGKGRLLNKAVKIADKKKEKKLNKNGKEYMDVRFTPTNKWGSILGHEKSLKNKALRIIKEGSNEPGDFKKFHDILQKEEKTALNEDFTWKSNITKIIQKIDDIDLDFFDFDDMKVIEFLDESYDTGFLEFNLTLRAKSLMKKGEIFSRTSSLYSEALLCYEEAILYAELLGNSELTEELETLIKEEYDIGLGRPEKKKEVEGVDFVTVVVAGKKLKFPNNKYEWLLSLKQWNSMSEEEVDIALEKGFG